MKRIFTILLVLGLVFGLMSAVSLAAETVESGKCGENLTWTFDSNGTLTISGTGAMADYSWKASAPWRVWSSNILEVVVEPGVTTIGSNGFAGCSEMKRISLPETLTGIGECAFTGCKALSEINLPQSLRVLGDYAFEGCESLVAVFLPDGLTTIGNVPFLDCAYLTSVVIPAGVTVDDSFIYSEYSLTHMFFMGPKSQAEPFLIGQTGYDFRWVNIHWDVRWTQQNGQQMLYCPQCDCCYDPWENYRTDELTWKLEDGVLTISGEGPMRNYNSNNAAPWSDYQRQIREVVIEPGVTRIGEYAFYRCESLEKITIADTVTDIGGWAFYGCSQLQAVAIPEGVTIIDRETFIYCYKLASVTLPSSLEEIRDRAFDSCYSLEELTIPGGLRTIGEDALSKHLRSVKILPGMTAINDYMFYDCTALTEISIPETVTTIGDYAFYNCSSLSGVIIPQGVTHIGESAFNACSSLTCLVLPETVTSIGDQALECTDALNEIHFRGTAEQLDSVSMDQQCRERLWHCDVDELELDGKVMYSCAQCGKFFDCNGPLTNVGPCGENLIWREEDGVVTISGTGEMQDYGDGTSPWCAKYDPYRVVISDGVTSIGNYAFAASGITEIVIPDSVTSIGAYAFRDSSSLAAITLPRTVTSIGAYAFYNCQCISSITIPRGVTEISDYTFYNCSGISSIAIPKTVTSIGDYAFYGCSSMSDISIPDSVKSIGEYAFYECNALTELTLPAGITEIEDYTFYGCRSLTGISIPEGVTRIGEGAFYYCDDLATVTIPASVKNIEKEAFYSCGNLKDITIPEGITQIKEGTFAWCSSLGDLTLPSTLTEIAADGFIGCRSFHSIDLPYGLTLLGDNAFSDCSELKHITLPETLCTVGEYVFSYCESLERITIPSSLSEIGWGMFHDCTKLKDVAMGNSVVKIGPYAFKNCESLERITIPSSVTEIGHYAFAGCSGLKHVVIPQGVTVIDWGTFEECISLERITIPAGVTVIGRYAFQYCYELTDVHFTGTEEQKAAIAIDTYNDKLADIPWHCSVAVEQQSGQTVYFCSQCDQHYLPDGSEPTEKAEISLIGQGFTLSFEDEILVNFYYTAENIDDVTEQGMLVFYNDPGAADIAKADDVYIGSVLSNGAFANTTKGIAAKKMGDEQYYCAYAKRADGTYAYSPLYSYSPEKYAMGRIQNSSNEELKALCVAMLNYGAAAQEFFGYRTDDLMNAGLTAEQQALVAEYDASLFAGAIPADPAKTGAFSATDTGFTKRNASVSFEGAFAINYYFTPEFAMDGSMKLYIWNSEVYEAAQTLTVDNAAVQVMTAQNGNWSASVTGIAPKKLDKTIYVAGVYEDALGNTYCTGVIAYSLSRYCMNNAKPGKPMQTLAANTAMYGYYANNYFA